MSDEVSEFTLASTSGSAYPPQVERPINPVIFFNMTGDNCPLPKNSDSFTLGEMIGSGSFAHVYKAVDKKTKETIAIKSYRMRKKDLSHFSRAATEMAFLRFLDHPNVMGYVLSDINKQYMCLGIQYSPYGSLANFMEKTVGFSEVTVQHVMKQLLSAICYLHSMNIFHGDIKPENVIVANIKNNNLIIQLSDFGLADVILVNQTYHKKSGSFYYMAPEIHLGFPSDHTSDLYSAGIVMYEMLFAQKPFNTKMPKELYITNLRRRIEVVYPRFESNFLSQSCLNLVKNLLSYDKQERLSGEKLAKHPFLNINLVQDKQSHYMRACECLLKGVEYVNSQEFGTGYLEITEAILHLKIHLNRIQSDEALYQYTQSRYADYVKYCEKIEEKLVCERSPGPIDMATQAERLRCLLKSTPALLNGYDICCVGEMYYAQQNKQKGSKQIKDGLNILFPLMINEPDGIRKQLLAAKIDQWMKMLEKMTQETKTN